MPEQSREWTVILSDVDRIKVRVVKNGNLIIEFSAQYETLILGHWRKITRYDNSHGSVPHRHVYSPNRYEYLQIMTVRNNNEAFTEALTIIKKNFMKVKENYIVLMKRVGRG